MLSRCLLSLGCLVLMGGSLAFGQNLVPNPSFETGTTNPDDWTLLNPGDGYWENLGRTGDRSISVSNNGVSCFRRWQTTGVPVQPGKPYLFRFWGMTTNVLNPNSRTCISGFDVATRDLQLSSQWALYSYVTVLPNNAVNPILRLGHCQVNGKLIFDDVEVIPVIPLPTFAAGYELGAGETFSPGKYAAKFLLNGANGNYARCLFEHTATFYTDGWSFAANQHVTYRHSFPGLAMTNAQIAIASKHQVGELAFEVSTNGTDWIEAGRHVTVTPGPISFNYSVAVPAAVLPAETLFVRLRAEGIYWVTEYRLEADLPGMTTTATGNTWFFEQQQPLTEVLPLHVEETPGGFVLALELRNAASTNREFALRSLVTGSAGERERLLTALVAAATTNTVQLELPSAGAGLNTANIEARDAATDAVLFTGGISMNVTWFRDSSFGYGLPGATNGTVWWSEATYKVNRHRFPPTATNAAIAIAAARNEYEPFQLVLRPEITWSNVTVSVSDLLRQAGGGATIPATNVEICLVEYVPVTELFDPDTELGDYPDPLPPLTAPFTAGAHTNQPLWFTVYVPKDAPAGVYEATITVQSDAATFQVPLQLRVFDFALSDVTHTKTAYGMIFYNFWQALTSLSQQREVWDLYMENFRKHRINPYLPQTFNHIKFTLTGGNYTYDFTDFDVAMERYLDEFNFTTFNWNEERAGTTGMLNLGGHTRFTPGYRENLKKLMPPILAHLREKGWLEKAYSYWFDEPLPKHYPFVEEGMQLMQEAAPDLRRMLTIYPEPPLYDTVDIWCPILVQSVYTLSYPRWSQRQQNGEEVWWYVASVPLVPIPNNFTEHPALYPRIRGWMAEKLGVSGELYWQAGYYFGDGFLPWNPWTNAMSYAGSGGPWGNGNGMLLYPPVKTLPTSPVIAGPINSLRWEMLREAQEDREYFWLLNELLQRAEQRFGPNHPAVVEGQAARAAALGLITTPLEYEQNPQSLYAQRERLAAAIEALDDGAPMIVRDPKTQAVALNQTVKLRTEALGWPMPQYQWQHHGTNIPGATEAVLTLNNIGPTHVGDYRVVVSNALGGATGNVARLAGYWEPTPQMLRQPESLVKKAGGSAVFAVTAVSANPLSYTWWFDSAPLADATNATLLLTNLTPAHAGEYQVIVSNVAGVITSAVATLTVPFVQSNLTLIPVGSVWKYHDEGVDLGTVWRATNYNDSGWSSGAAQLGYGDGDEQTIVSFGSDPDNKHITTYFRHTFLNPFTNAPLYLVARMIRDDGAIAYLNGAEVYRSQNMPDGVVTFDSLAQGFWESAEVTGANESTFFAQSVPVAPLRPGLNVLAVEVHQYSTNSDDLSFEFELVGTWTQPPHILLSPASVTRRPGQSVSFNVTVASAEAPGYQWRSNGIPIANATGPTLTLGPLTTESVGEYSVIVSNSAGSVTSAPAWLTMTPLPEARGSWATDGSGFELLLPADAAALTVQASTNLVEWTDLFTFPAGAGPASFTDPNTTGHAYRFYRLRVNP